MQKLDRTVFEISRELEFFNEKELTMQIGHDKELWPVALLKELIDNSLDACEASRIPPKIEVTVEDDSFSVRDNGAGLPEKILKDSLNYLKRVSDKTFYVSPTRGQLGNALKVVWAASFVAHGEYGQVEVWSEGLHHIVDVSVDRISQTPRIEHNSETGGFVKNGTFVKVHWPDLACLLKQAEDDNFYNSVLTPNELIEGYAVFNPHATFKFGDKVFKATDFKWKKWNPTDPTSPIGIRRRPFVI